MTALINFKLTSRYYRLNLELLWKLMFYFTVYINNTFLIEEIYL